VVPEELKDRSASMITVGVLVLVLPQASVAT
jgi:hypothetical protein